MSSPFLLILFVILWSLYIPLNRRPSKYYWHLAVDELIPLIYISIYPYLSYFLYIPVGIVFTWRTPYIQSLLTSLIIAQAIGVTFWYLFPNGVKRPRIKSRDFTSQILARVLSGDNDTNGFPSSHVYISLVATYYLVFALPTLSILWILIGSLITLSTLTTKQHYILDVVGGLFTAILAVTLTSYFI